MSAMQKMFRKIKFSTEYDTLDFLLEEVNLF